MLTVVRINLQLKVILLRDFLACRSQYDYS